MATNEFDWVPFYKEFAEKLLEYRNNRPALIQLIKDVFKNIKFDMPKLERDNNVVDIDPFTVYGLFNKGQTNENRQKIIGGFKQALSMQSGVPSKFDGIPVINALNATYYEFLPERGEEVIDDLWEFFSVALDYSKANTQAKRKEFEKWFDIAIKKKYNGNSKTTIGLFWCAPDCFLNLDKVNIEYIYKRNELPTDLVKELPVIPAKMSGKIYLDILTKISVYLSSEISKFENFYELSHKAWLCVSNIKPGPEPKPEPEPVPKTPKAETCANYWFLNANPKIWSMATMPVGEAQDYTLYNGNGNKRKVFQNFLDAKAGDMVIGYECTPVKKVVALMQIEAENDGECLYFKKLEGLNNPIEYSRLKDCPELEKMQFLAMPQGSLFKLTKEEYDCIYDMIRDDNPPLPPDVDKLYTKADFLKDVYMSEEKYDRLVAVLTRKKNIILQGAPGVGKTFAAKRLAYSIMGKVKKENVEFIQFHQNYSYEDFIMGYKPKEDGFELKYGIFYKFCQRAASHPDEDFFFIIDEINRGNMSKIFGELLMLIENDYRKEAITLAYDDLKFSVPERLHIIGLMNTADRSLAMIDYALRRRFSFFEMEPGFDTDGFINYQKGLNNETFDALVGQIGELNEDIANDKSLGKGFCIGHSYFCNATEASCTIEWMRDVVDFDIMPMLEEYWFDDEKKVRSWQERLEEVFE